MNGAATVPWRSPDTALLDLLLRAQQPLTINALAQAQDVSPPTISSAIERLCAAGCRFDDPPQQGLRLVEAGLGVWADYLAGCSSTRRSVAVYARTTSTQDICRQRIEQAPGNGDNELVVADEQTAGRGRLGRCWTAPAGTAVLFSRVHVAQSDRSDRLIDRVTFAVSVALATALDPLLQAPHRPVTIKWPNDLCVHGRKLGGILVETISASDRRHAIIGVGINVGLRSDQMPTEIRRQATSLVMCGTDTHRLLVLGEAVRAIDDALQQRDLNPLLQQWRRRCAILHQRVTLQNNGQVVEGQVVDLEPHLGLIVRSDSGTMLHLPAATTTVLKQDPL